MKEENQIEILLKKKKPNLSYQSVRAYITGINVLANSINKKLENEKDIIENIEAITDILMSFNTNTRKTRIAGLITILNDGEKNSEKVEKIIKDLRKQMYLDLDEIKNKDEKQVLSKSQKENFIPWSEVLEKYNEMKADVAPLLKKDNLNRDQFFKLQDFILLSLYVLIPPRRSQDYTEFKLRNYDTTDDSKDNYMLVEKGKAFFVFNSYKNSSRLGQQKVQIPVNLKNLILQFSDYNKTDYLLVNRKNEKINQVKVTELLNNIFGKSISSSMLRHIYLTHKYGDIDLKEINETTEEMGNSNISRSLAYVSKQHKSK